MGSKEKIGMLESLLARIRTRAAEPRPVMAAEVHAAPVATGPVTAPPPPEAAVALRQASSPEIAAVVPPVPEAPPPMESRERLVGEDRSAPEEVVELDDRHIVPDDAEVSVSVAEAEIDESILAAEAAAAEEAAPPSSKRPISEPLAEPMPVEAPKHTPPPESGKQVAALSFDDDFTGVREANKGQPVLEADLTGEAIPRASPRPPGAAAKHEMEADLPSGAQTAPGQFTPDLVPAPPPTPKPASKPPSVRLPSERPPALAMEPEVVKPLLAMTAKAAVFEGSISTFKPTTFAELLDASLSL